MFMVLLFFGFSSFAHVVPEKGKRHEYLISIYPYLSPLSKAIADGDTKKALALIQQGADVHAKDSKGHTALHVVSLTGDMEMASLLFKKGVDVNVKDNDMHTALHGAALVGHMEMAVLFIQQGADVDAKDIEGVTPFERARRNGHTEIASLLLKSGAEPPGNDAKEIKNLKESKIKKSFIEMIWTLFKKDSR